METSVFQLIKLTIVEMTGLSKDALHIHGGFIVFVVAYWVLGSKRTLVAPLIAVAAVALIAEALDMRDDLATFGHWRWMASLRDIVNTIFWPAVLTALAAFRLLPFRRSS